MEREFYLGRTDNGEHVFADVSVEESTGRIVEFTDHSEGIAPERISVTFTLLAKHAPVNARGYQTRAIPDAYWLSTGQIPQSERIIATTPPSAIPAEKREFIEMLWRDYHLNDLHAGCIHQPEGSYLGTVCPETGYKWGTKWLAESVPTDILDRAKALIRQ